MKFNAPAFTPKPGKPLSRQDETLLLHAITMEGLWKKLNPVPPAYYMRINEELNIIEECGAEFVMLEAHRATQLCAEHGLGNSPGRGSVGCSLVAWVLGITFLDPIKLNLPFERFISVAAVNAGKVPDIDLDCSDKARALLRSDLEERYGTNRVFGLSQQIFYRHKSAVSAAGGHKQTEDLRKRFFHLPHGELAWPRPKNEEEADIIRRAKELMDKPVMVNGKPKLNPHPGGVVVLPEAWTPASAGAEVIRPVVKKAARIADDAGIVLLDPKDKPRLSLSAKEADQQMLMKLDYLSSEHLPFLVGMSDEIWGATPNGRLGFEAHVDLEDPSIYDMATSPKGVYGIFQLQGPAMSEKMLAFSPASFNDLAILSAATRPGVPMDELLHRRHGRVPCVPPHPCLEKLLAPTYGLMVFQEHMLVGLRELAGFAIPDAMGVLKAISKKVPAELDIYRERFYSGFVEKHGGDPSALWSIYERGADYVFSLAHSAAYAVTGAWELWAKANHPEVFARQFVKCFGNDRAAPVLLSLGITPKRQPQQEGLFA